MFLELTCVTISGVFTVAVISVWIFAKQETSSLSVVTSYSSTSVTTVLVWHLPPRVPTSHAPLNAREAFLQLQFSSRSKSMQTDGRTDITGVIKHFSFAYIQKKLINGVRIPEVQHTLFQQIREYMSLLPPTGDLLPSSPEGRGSLQGVWDGPPSTPEGFEKCTFLFLLK